MAEVDLSTLAWRKSSACFESNCVEVAAGKGLVMVRDTRDSGSVTLTFSYRDWHTFLRRVRDNVSCRGHALHGNSKLPRDAIC